MVQPDQTLKFPKGFLWGTATAAHQIEGDNVNSDWWAWEQAGKVKEKSGRACNSWNCWKEDIDLAKSINNNAYRFSLEWARIEPEEGKFNLEALKHYEEEIKYLHKLGMKAIVTLWHFSSPNWFSQKGGFCKFQNSKYFLRYINFVLDNLLEYPDYWITLNEPNGFIHRALILGEWAPGKRNLFISVFSYIYLLVSHAKAYDLIHKKLPQAKVSLSPHIIFVKSISGNWLLKFWEKISDLLANWSIYLPLIKKLDFIAVNYYIVHMVNFNNLIPHFGNAKRTLQLLQGEATDLGWPIYPQGLYQFLLQLKKFNLPVIITENGIADSVDNKREKFISGHLEYIHEAIQEGVKVEGYFHWTLFDNFEWAMGYEPKFGLFETNFKTFERKPRSSAAFYSKICGTNSLTLISGGV